MNWQLLLTLPSVVFTQTPSACHSLQLESELALQLLWAFSHHGLGCSSPKKATTATLASSGQDTLPLRVEFIPVEALCERCRQWTGYLLYEKHERLCQMC